MIHRKSAAALYDTKTVTTASGKVIEVEVKPEDLVAEVGEGSGFSESDTIDIMPKANMSRSR